MKKMKDINNQLLLLLKTVLLIKEVLCRSPCHSDIHKSELLTECDQFLVGVQSISVQIR